MDIFDDQSTEVKSVELEEVNEQINSHRNDIWEVRHTAKSIDEVILPSQFKTSIKYDIEQGEIKEYLFYGTNGVGKSMTGELIFKAHNIPYKIINCAIDKSISIIETEIISYIKQTTLDGRPKGVILDELGSRYSEGFQDAMKRLMIQYQDVARFIITTNNIDKIDTGLISRSTVINFGGTNDKETITDLKVQMCKRLVHVATEEIGAEAINDSDGKLKQDARTTITNIVHHYYPQIRDMINALSHNISCNEGKEVKGNDYIIQDADIVDINNLLREAKWKEARIKYNSCVVDHTKFIKPFIDYVTDKVPTQHQYSVAFICAKWIKDLHLQVEPELIITGGMFSELIGYYGKM